MLAMYMRGHIFKVATGVLGDEALGATRNKLSDKISGEIRHGSRISLPSDVSRRLLTHISTLLLREAKGEPIGEKANLILERISDRMVDRIDKFAGNLLAQPSEQG